MSDAPYRERRVRPTRASALRRSRAGVAPNTLRHVIVVVTHPEFPDMRSILWFWPGLAAPMLFLITLSSDGAA